MPLPLRPNAGGIELIRVLRRFDRVGHLANIWFPELHYWLARTVAIGIGTYDGKPIFPDRGLEMDNSTIRSLVLKMQEPPFAYGRIDERTLVRAIDGSLSLSQNDLFLVWPVNVL